MRSEPAPDPPGGRTPSAASRDLGAADGQAPPDTVGVRSGAERLAAFRAREFRRLDEAGLAYLDYTGSGLFAESHVREHAELLLGSVLGNPHSESAPSSLATGLIDRTRADVLDFFGADPETWHVCFTANASAASKLVGEAFPFAPGSRYVLAYDNHNSVNGIREYAAARGAEVIALALDDDLRLPDAPLPACGSAPSLFGFPAQSNFSGVQHPLDLIARARDAGYRVLLDAAAFAPTNELRLDAVEPDFVCLSFYKMFGFPTGVGALIGRREALDRLARPWFAGGTVEWVTVADPHRSLLPTAEGFEDGTPNFLDIAAVSPGLARIRDLGIATIHEHVAALTADLLDRFASARHTTGAPRVATYGPKDGRARGGTVAFNLLDAAGRVLEYEKVERAAREAGIALRGGCFCNPGASETAFGIDPQRALGCLGNVPRGAFHPRRLGDCLDGDPVGALRASFGWASVPRDIDRLMRLVIGLTDG